MGERRGFESWPDEAETVLADDLDGYVSLVHPPTSAMSFQFPT